MAEKKKLHFGYRIVFYVGAFVAMYLLSTVFTCYVHGKPVTAENVASNFTDSTTLALAVAASLVLILFTVLGTKPSSPKLKGKDKMDNQKFLTEKELDKNFKHYYYDELKNVAISGVPFRAFYKNGRIKIHFAESCHSLIVGATGTGKTVSWMEPTIQILSELKSKPSMFITDPKGELFAHHSLKLQNNGYKVLQLDLTDPYNSNQWNPLEFIYTEYQRQLHLE